MLSRTLQAVSRRSYATSASSQNVLDLAFDHHAAPSAGPTKGSLVILHGLYGSKQNWRSLSKALAQQTQRDVFALDLRNHGTSPHSQQNTYAAMASDVSHFLKGQDLRDIVLMGHSMGGKVAMAHALTEPDSIDKLISVDMSPAKGKISPEFAKYIEGSREVEKANVTSKKDADVILQNYEESLPIRQFLLTNLVRTDNNASFKFRIPLDILYDSIGSIGDFPYTESQGATFDKPMLFIKGANSKYINRKNIPVGEAFFPNSEVKTIEGAGHWVHSEKPKEFVDIVTRFCAA